MTALLDGRMLRISMFSAALVALSATAAAQPTNFDVCPERRHVLSLMAERFAQGPVAMGLSNNGDLLELLTNPTNGDWTLLATSADGRSCQLAAGTAWQDLTANRSAEPDA
jgi:hypothetical protein